MKEAAGKPMLRLEAYNKVAEYETRAHSSQPFSPEAQVRKRALRRKAAELLMRGGDLDALKRLALKGEENGDSVALRTGWRKATAGSKN